MPDKPVLSPPSMSRVPPADVPALVPPAAPPSDPPAPAGDVPVLVPPREPPDRGPSGPSPPQPFARQPRDSRWKLLSLLAFVVLAGVALAVVVLLPQRVERGAASTAEAPSPPSPVAAAPAPPVPQVSRDALPAATDRPAAVGGEGTAAQTALPVAGDRPVPEATPRESAAAARAAARARAETLLDKALERRAALESAGVADWGQEDFDGSYAAALATLSAANADLDAERFEAAASGYGATIEALDRLEASRPSRLRAALAAGLQALEGREPEVAAERFTLALAIDPADTDAQQGLERARKLPQVLERFAAAGSAETAGELAAARDAYAEAASLDAQFTPASEGLARVDDRIRDRDFRKAMSDALAALERADFGGARRALAVARETRPNAPELRDLGRRIEVASRAAHLERLRARGASAEHDERWAEAVDLYDQALAVDASASFAIAGKARAGSLVELHRQMEYYLSKPERLYASEPLAHARQVYEAAMGVGRAGPGLRDGRERLAVLIERASTPVSVVLRSDQATDVVVYRVQRLGAFRERRLTLPPGNYTAVGTRTGYRDVKIKFDVSPSNDGIVVVIACEEPI